MVSREEEAVSGAVWKEVADEETMLLDDSLWASMDMGDGERRSVEAGNTAAAAIVLDNE